MGHLARLSPNRQQLKLTIWLIYFRFNVSDLTSTHEVSVDDDGYRR